jgi:hypothetical protein
VYVRFPYPNPCQRMFLGFIIFNSVISSIVSEQHQPDSDLS